MKKFFAITSVAALVAGAAAALDVSAMVQIDGNLLNFAVTDDGPVIKGPMLKAYDPSSDSDYLWKLSVSGEKSGFEIWEWDLSNSSISNVKLWFAPTDFLKFTVGNVGGESIAKPMFEWESTTADDKSYGYQAEVSLNNISAKVAIQPGAGSYFFNNTADGYDQIGGFWAEAKYTDSWGAVQAVVCKNGYIGAHGFSNWVTSPLALGVAYANMEEHKTGCYGDFFVSFKNSDDGLAFQGIDSQIGGQWDSGTGLFIQETNLFQFRNAFKYGFEIKATYDFDAVVVPYVLMEGYDVMAHSSALTFALGMDTKVGDCAINAYINVPVIFTDSYQFSFSVPVEFEIKL